MNAIERVLHLGLTRRLLTRRLQRLKYRFLHLRLTRRRVRLKYRFLHRRLRSGRSQYRLRSRRSLSQYRRLRSRRSSQARAACIFSQGATSHTSTIRGPSHLSQTARQGFGAYGCNRPEALFRHMIFLECAMISNNVSRTRTRNSQNRTGCG